MSSLFDIEMVKNYFFFLALPDAVFFLLGFFFDLVTLAARILVFGSNPAILLKAIGACM